MQLSGTISPPFLGFMHHGTGNRPPADPVSRPSIDTVRIP